MQTFLPYSDFQQTAKCLDYKRLGKQRVEAKQILNILLDRTKTKGWRNHPAVLMWSGYDNALKKYYNIILDEWISRGYNNSMTFECQHSDIIYPKFIGNYDFHNSHRSNLLRKDPTYYGKYNWNVSSTLPYIWGNK